MRHALAALVASAIAAAGCALDRPVPEIAVYDLGGTRSGNAASGAIAPRIVEVVSPSWLETSALQYRLAFADAERRHSYADSRWAAPPPELLAHALRRALAANGSAGLSGGCMLRIELEEFIQVFDAPASSRAIVEARALLIANGDDRLLARRDFRLEDGAASADAPGGVDALARVSGAAVRAISDWLDGLDRGSAAGLNIGKICRGG